MTCRINQISQSSPSENGRAWTCSFGSASKPGELKVAFHSQKQEVSVSEWWLRASWATLGTDDVATSTTGEGHPAGCPPGGRWRSGYITPSCHYGSTVVSWMSNVREVLQSVTVKISTLFGSHLDVLHLVFILLWKKLYPENIRFCSVKKSIIWM